MIKSKEDARQYAINKIGNNDEIVFDAGEKVTEIFYKVNQCGTRFIKNETNKESKLATFMDAVEYIYRHRKQFNKK